VEPHPTFKRRGDDILLEFQVNIAQAALGSDIVVPTLDGDAKIAVAPGTQSGTVLRLRDQGVPHLQRNGRGDQMVVLHVAVPEDLTPEQKRLIRELGETLDPGGVWEEKHTFMDSLRELFGL